jgi:hypothetical protein
VFLPVDRFPEPSARLRSEEDMSSPFSNPEGPTMRSICGTVGALDDGAGAEMASDDLLLGLPAVDLVRFKLKNGMGCGGDWRRERKEKRLLGENKV